MSENPHKAYYAIIPANVRYDEDLTPNAKLLYGEITALCNQSGACWATNDYFAKLYGVSKTSISKWIRALCEKGYVTSEIVYKEGTKEILKRYLRIVNDPTQQKLNTPPQEKLKENNTSINTTINNTKDNNNTSKDADALASTDIEKEFENLWSLYPRKQGKANALKAYKKARKGKPEIYQAVEDGIRRYSAYLKKNKTKQKFIAQGSTWFAQQRWLDDYTTGGNNHGSATGDISKTEPQYGVVL